MRVQAICLLAGLHGANVPSPAPLAADDDGRDGVDDGPRPDARQRGNGTARRAHSLLEDRGERGDDPDAREREKLAADVLNGAEVEVAQKAAAALHTEELSHKAKEIEKEYRAAYAVWDKSNKELEIMKAELMKVDKELRYRLKIRDQHQAALNQMWAAMPSPSPPAVPARRGQEHFPRISEEPKYPKGMGPGPGYTDAARLSGGGLLLHVLLMVVYVT